MFPSSCSELRLLCTFCASSALSCRVALETGCSCLPPNYRTWEDASFEVRAARTRPPARSLRPPSFLNSNVPLHARRSRVHAGPGCVSHVYKSGGGLHPCGTWTCESQRSLPCQSHETCAGHRLISGKSQALPLPDVTVVQAQTGVSGEVAMQC